MDAEQKEFASRFFSTAGPWVISVLLGFVCFYLSEINSDFKTMKRDVQDMRMRVNKVETTIDYMSNYELKRK